MKTAKSPTFSCPITEKNSTKRAENCKITHLVLSKNKFDVDCATVLEGALSHENCSVTDLELQRCTQKTNSRPFFILKSVANSLDHETCRITHLNLSWNTVDVDSGTALANALQHEHCKSPILTCLITQSLLTVKLRWQTCLCTKIARLSTFRVCAPLLPALSRSKMLLNMSLHEGVQ